MTKQQQKKINVTPIAAGDLLTPKQVAEILGVSPNTLAKWRSTGEKNLPYIKLGGPTGRVRYTNEVVTAHVAASPKRGYQAA